MAFKDVFEKIGEEIQDLTELTVTTIEGDLTLQGQAQIDSLDDLLKSINAQATTNAKVVASTRTRLDGDTIAYYDNNIDDAKRQAHADLVGQAAATREATIDMFKEIAGIGN